MTIATLTVMATANAHGNGNGNVDTAFTGLPVLALPRVTPSAEAAPGPLEAPPGR
ncbi:hypothetical protein H4V95_000669 [Arthrobacter sp. CAN_C5]|nr:hypothetical protein [Arthrobacter sp. CAN_C5]